MVIPGNLHSQLRVLDSSQQLYAPLFLASSPSSANTLFSKLSEKLPSEKLFRLSTSLPHFSPSSDLFYDLCRSHLFCPLTMLSPPTISPKQNPLLFYNVVTSNDLCSSHISCTTTMLSPPFLQQLPFLLSHPRPLTACGTPFQKVPPRVKVLL